MTKLSNLFKSSLPRPTLSRRGFIVATGATGLSIGVLASCKSETPEATAPDYSKLPPNPEVNAWVHIHHDDRVTVRIARSEMGQGTSTGLAQLVAEELDCDWENIGIEFPTPGENLKRDRVWGDYSTGGSQGLRGSQQYVREGGAAARQMLIAAAAAKWDVPADECTTEKSRIFHKASGQEIGYGAIADAAAQMDVPETVELKEPKDWTIIGKPKMRLDTADKLTGKLKYGQDIEMDGMLVASVRACPILGGTLKSFDASALDGRPGIKKVLKIGDPELQVNDAVVVIADSWWTANSALDDIKYDWDGGEFADFSSADFEKVMDAGFDANDSFTGNEGGDVAQAMEDAVKTIEATYNFPSLNHAPMEPMNATALWTADKCEVWCPTQNGESALTAASKASGLELAQCDVYKTFLGGGFGRRGMNDYVSQAVLVAKEMPGTPIKLMWSREEDMAQGWNHPITKARMRGGIDAEGKLSALDMKISGQSILAVIIPQFLDMMGGMDAATFQGLAPENTIDPMKDQRNRFSFPNYKIHHAMRNPPIRPGFWRGVNLNPNALYLNCFLDEMAHASGRDPLEFWLDNITEHPKLAEVLKAAAKGGGYGSNDGKARGLACIYGFGSYVAACAEVKVSDEGELDIVKITAATDCGHAANPQQIEAQVEGSFVYGLSAMLFQEMTYENGQAQQSNFHDFDSMRIKHMPEVETIIMPSGGFWGGVGEPTIAVAAPAVLNAIFAATGKRVRQLPIKDQDLRG